MSDADKPVEDHEGDDEDHEVPGDLLALHVAIEADQAGLL